jgi:hypothetical protein
MRLKLRKKTLTQTRFLKKKTRLNRFSKNYFFCQFEQL